MACRATGSRASTATARSTQPSTSAAAQTAPTFGVKGGVNFANLNFDSDDVNMGFDRRTGLVAGGFVLWPVQDAFSLQVEGLFSQKGATVEEDGAEGSIKLDFFEPFEAHNTAEFTLEGKGDATTVTWAMYGPATFISKLMGRHMLFKRQLEQLICGME